MSGLEYAFIGDRISAIHTAATKLGISLASYHWNYDAVQDMDAELDELFRDDGETRRACLTDPIESHVSHWYKELPSEMTGVYSDNTKSLLREFYEWMRKVYHIDPGHDCLIGKDVTAICLDEEFDGHVVYIGRNSWTGENTYMIYSPSFLRELLFLETTCFWCDYGSIRRIGLHPVHERIFDRIYNTFTPDQVEGEGA